MRRFHLRSPLVAGLAALAFVAMLEAGEGEAAFERGRDAFRAQDYSQAAAAFEEAVASEPGNTEYLLRLGIAYGRMEDWPQAKKTYERLLELDPQHARALHNLGNLYLRQSLFEEAADHYGRALTVDPDYLLALYHQGYALWHLNRTDEAEALFARCLVAPPASNRDQVTQLDCRFYMGRVRFRAEDYAQAATLMEQVLTTSPSHMEARYYLGRAYVRLGRTEEGKQQLAIHRQMLQAKRIEPVERQIEPDEPE